MGFGLWIDRDQAWAQGTSEYRAMGAAVISVTDIFLPRDFRPRRRIPHLEPAQYQGMFPSIGALNLFLKQPAAKPARWRGR